MCSHLPGLRGAVLDVRRLHEPGLATGRRVVPSLREACDRCAAECGKHQADHCKRCAEACRRCAEECRKMAA